MKKCTVLYEAWQMKCCGDPFCKNDVVKWLVCKAGNLITGIDIGEVDYCYEAHSSEWTNLYVLEGIVEEIKILYEKHAPSKNNPNLLVPISGELVEAEKVEGFEEWDDMQASGYLVLLKEYTIRPAEKSEVSFK